MKTISEIPMNKVVESFVNSMKYKPSTYQVDVFKALMQTNHNIVVNAVAGSGKTTTLMSLLKLINDKKVLVVAFNKTIAEELKHKVSNLGLNANVTTAHGFGLSVLMRNGIKITEDIKESKYRLLFTNGIKFTNGDNKLLSVFKNLTEEHLNSVRKLSIPKWINEDASSLKQYNANIYKIVDLARKFASKTDSDIESILMRYDIRIIANELDNVKILLSIGRSYLSMVDFDDLLWLPNELGLKVDGYDFVLIDECQDINNSARHLLLKARKYNVGRFIAVGDVNQAIYGFAGANSESFNELQKQFNTITLPLSLCYRCGSDIIEMAKQYVPQIVAHESTGTGIVNLNGSIKTITQNDLILCRNSAPLVKLAFDYIKNGVVAIIKGRDVANGIINLIKNTNKTLAIDVIDALVNDLNKLLKSIMRGKNLTEDEAYNEQEFINAQDKFEIINMLSENCNNASEMINKINSMFSDDNVKNAIQLSTIHRAKGLEADNVFIIEKSKMPSKFAKLDWEIKQEENLIYVAYTRAMKSLHIVTDWSYESDTADSLKKKADIKVSDFVGVVGSKVSAEFNITDIQSVMGFEGYPTNVYKLQDNYGNVWSKWTTIDDKFIIGDDKEIKVGTKIKCQALIKAHTLFNGVKINAIKTLSKFDAKTDISLTIK